MKRYFMYFVSKFLNILVTKPSIKVIETKVDGEFFSAYFSNRPKHKSQGITRDIAIVNFLEDNEQILRIKIKNT